MNGQATMKCLEMLVELNGIIKINKTASTHTKLMQTHNYNCVIFTLASDFSLIGLDARHSGWNSGTKVIGEVDFEHRTLSYIINQM